MKIRVLFFLFIAMAPQVFSSRVEAANSSVTSASEEEKLIHTEEEQIRQTSQIVEQMSKIPASSEKGNATLTSKDESQIPVFVESEKKATSEASPLTRVFLSCFVLISLTGGSYFLLRKYKFKNEKKVQHQIKVITQHHLGPRKSLAVIRVAGESILVGVTDHHISMIKSLALLDEDLPESTPEKFDAVMKDQPQEGMHLPPATKVTFSGFTEKFKKTDEKQTSTTQEDEFAIQGIQDMVKSKLKSMRNLQS